MVLPSFEPRLPGLRPEPITRYNPRRYMASAMYRERVCCHAGGCARVPRCPG